MTAPAARPSRCSHVRSCELFPRFGLRASLKVWKTCYCDGQYERCERFQRALRGEPVPPTLLPNGKELLLDPQAGTGP